MNIARFLQEDNGNESSMRLLVAFVVLAIMGTWAYVSIVAKSLQPLDWQTVGALVGPLFAKAWQKGRENAGAGPA